MLYTMDIEFSKTRKKGKKSKVIQIRRPEKTVISGQRCRWKDRIWPNYTDIEIIVSSLTYEHWKCFEDFNREVVLIWIFKRPSLVIMYRIKWKRLEWLEE